MCDPTGSLLHKVLATGWVESRPRPLLAGASRLRNALRPFAPHCCRSTCSVDLPLSYARSQQTFSLSVDMTRATLHSNWGCQTSSYINMDHTCIPCCALNRQITTVIIRTKMEVKDNHCRSKGCPNSDCPKVVHRLSSCENCNRTRFNNQYSDCDSGLVGKCRTYKCRAARSSKHFFLLLTVN